jgi:N-methylhydantoinase A
VRLLVRRQHRKTVPERLTADRTTVLQPTAVRPAAREFRAEGLQAIAVFLFSYLNPVHEQRAAAILREAAIARWKQVISDGLR